MQKTSVLKLPKRDSTPIYTSESQFTNFKELSCRRTSKVFRAQCIVTGMEVAIKRFQKSDLTAKEAVHVAREVHLMGTLRAEEGIIHILGFFEDENYAYIVMEYCAGRDLYQSVIADQNLDEHFAASKIVSPLLATLERLHNVHHIIHRDIKPENVLLTASGEIRLADFGTAIQCDHEVPFLAVGTLDFMAPEVLGSFAPKGAVESPCTTPEMLLEAGLTPYDYKADVWSLGALAYELVVGEPPFYHEEAEETRNLILRSAFLYIPSRFQRTPFARFVTAAMTKDPNARPSAAELLKHEWLAQHAQQDLVLQETKQQIPSGDRRKKTNSFSLAIHVDASGQIRSATLRADDAGAPPARKKSRSTTKNGGKEDNPALLTKEVVSIAAIIAENLLIEPMSKVELSDGGASAIAKGLSGKLSAANGYPEDEPSPNSVLTHKYSSGALSNAGDYSTDAAGVEQKAPGQLRRIRSALSPQGSWLKKFSIRRMDDGANDETPVAI